MQSFPWVTVCGSDYTYQGEVVSVFYKRRGALRCVVEDSNGRLFIHNAKQLNMDDAVLSVAWREHQGRLMQEKLDVHLDRL